MPRCNGEKSRRMGYRAFIAALIGTHQSQKGALRERPTGLYLELCRLFAPFLVMIDFTYTLRRHFPATIVYARGSNCFREPTLMLLETKDIDDSRKFPV